MTTSSTAGNPPDAADPAPAGPPAQTHHVRRRRRFIASTTLVTVIGMLLANAVTVTRQHADATGTSIVHLDGGDLHVSQDGPQDAPALVLVHGLGASTNWWSRILPALATSYRVIRIDLLGHGQSAKPTGDHYAIPQQAHLLGRALDQLGVKSAILIGHSTGGYVATALAEQRPSLVTAIALLDTGPRMEAFVSEGPVGQLVFTPVLGQLLWRLRTDAIIRRSLSTAFAPGFTIPQQLISDTRSLTYHSLTAASRASDKYLEQQSVPERLKFLGKPLLVVFGDQDQRWMPSSASSYRVVPGARIALLPGVGHSPMLENPPRTAALLLDFIRSVPSTR